MKVTQKYVASKSGSNFASVKEAFDQLCSDILAQDTNEYFSGFLNTDISNVTLTSSDTIEIIREWNSVNVYLDYCKARDAYFANYDDHLATFIGKVGWSVSDSVEPLDE